MNDGQIPNSRRLCTCAYGLQSCRGISAGVAKQPREGFISHPRLPIRNFFPSLYFYSSGTDGVSARTNSTPASQHSRRHAQLPA
jgi:hypothetical protein